MSKDAARYNFIIPDDSGASLEELANAEVDDLSHLIRMGGKYSWTLQTYHYLKAQGLPVKLSHSLDPDCVNLAHGNYLRSAGVRWNCFAVCLQGDYPHFSLARYHIVQNMAQESANASFIPFWPQIGQISRDPERTTVKRVAYQGRINFTDLDADALNQDLNLQGIEFVPLENWQDLSSIDVLVGIRHYGRKLYRRKPASKLVNAWHAGIPFVGGWDSAYADIGTPDENYLKVESHDELVQAVLRLKNDDRLYAGLVSAGADRAREFTPEAIAQKWITLLETKAWPVYLDWRDGSGSGRLSFEAQRMKYRAAATAKAIARAAYTIPPIKRIRDLYYDPLG